MKYSLKKIIDNGTQLTQSVITSAERERKETAEALQIINKMLSGNSVTKEEKRFVRAQSMDLLKIVPLVALAMIPTPIPTATLLVVLGKKYGIDFLPNSHKQAENRLRRIKMRKCMKRVVRLAEIRIKKATSYNRVKGRLSYRFASDEIIQERINYDKTN
jgi:hypothetical protein